MPVWDPANCSNHSHQTLKRPKPHLQFLHVLIHWRPLYVTPPSSEREPPKRAALGKARSAPSPRLSGAGVPRGGWAPRRGWSAASRVGLNAGLFLAAADTNPSRADGLQRVLLSGRRALGAFGADHQRAAAMPRGRQKSRRAGRRGPGLGRRVFCGKRTPVQENKPRFPRGHRPSLARDPPDALAAPLLARQERRPPARREPPAALQQPSRSCLASARRPRAPGCKARAPRAETKAAPAAPLQPRGPAAPEPSAVAGAEGGSGRARKGCRDLWACGPGERGPFLCQGQPSGRGRCMSPGLRWGALEPSDLPFGAFPSKCDRWWVRKVEVVPPGEGGEAGESGEEAVLHYEGRITELLATIARLQGKIERLQQNKAREEENFSDLGSESTASLPRCPPLFASWTRSPSPPPAGPEDGKADLFRDVHKAVTALENTVLSYRSRLPSVEAELEGCAQVAEGCRGKTSKSFDVGTSAAGTACVFSEGLEARLGKLRLGSLGSFHQEALEPTHERKIGLYKERNAALRAELGAKEETLSRSKASLSAYQEERSKLQRKVEELQESLSRVEVCSEGAPSPRGEGEPRGVQVLESEPPPGTGGRWFRHPNRKERGFFPNIWSFPHFFDPSGAAQNGLHPLRGATGIQPAHTLSASDGSLEQLHRSVERLSRLNRLLSGALQESKTDAERISLLLGRRESDHAALALAVRCSERCLEAYETLWKLTVTEPEPRPETEGGAPRAGEATQRRGASLPHYTAAGWVPLLVSLPGPKGVPSNANPALDTAFRFLQACSTASQRSWEQGGIQESSPEVLGSGEAAKERLRERIRRLRAELGSLKLPAHQLSPGLDSVAARLNAGIRAKVAEGRRAVREVLPGLAMQPKMEKAQLLRELHAARVSMQEKGSGLQSSLNGRKANWGWGRRREWQWSSALQGGCNLAATTSSAAQRKGCVGLVLPTSRSACDQLLNRAKASLRAPGPALRVIRTRQSEGARLLQLMSTDRLLWGTPSTSPTSLCPGSVQGRLSRGPSLPSRALLLPSQEGLADLGTRLHLTAKEKQGLELWTHTLQAREAACLLVIQTLQQEHRERRGQRPPSSGSGSGSSGSEGGSGVKGLPGPLRPHPGRQVGPSRDAGKLVSPARELLVPHTPNFGSLWTLFPERDGSEHTPVGIRKRSLPAASEPVGGSLAKMEPEALMLRLLDTLARIRVLKDRLETLLTDLEERSHDCKAHEAQEMALVQDFFEAHSSLLFAYQKARRKQDSRVGQLETQMGLMSGRQAKQRQALMQTLQQRQDQVPAGVLTSLPQAPALDAGTLDLPGSLEAMPFSAEEKVRLPGQAQTRWQATNRGSPTVNPL
ncbi:harmonin-binding protein USHBP1 [Candoia aspera]|uniref:harmonin-binding protein USHBP1 n=1 Tax=Candoia aspera TaxID=51853 RepID=UPI002FD7BB00